MEISYSGPQLCLWVRMVVSGTHDLEEPSQVPMITGLVLKHQKQETLFDALPGVATVLVKALRPTLNNFLVLAQPPVFQTILYTSLFRCMDALVSLSLGNPASLIHVM